MLNKLFALSALAALVSLAGCNSSDSNTKTSSDNQQAEPQPAPSIVAEDVSTIAGLALTTQPNLPLDPHSALDDLFAGPLTLDIIIGNTAAVTRGSQNKVAIGYTHPECPTSGTYEIDTLLGTIEDDVIYPPSGKAPPLAAYSNLDFQECAITGGNSSIIADGSISVTAERQFATDQTTETLIDVIIQAENFSLSMTDNGVTQTTELHGSLGWSYVADPATASSTTMLGGTGSIHLSTPEEDAVITFTEFGSVIENSPSQQVQYLHGSVVYSKPSENIDLEYTVTTITPFGMVDGIEQGLLEVTSGISKIIMSYQGDQQWSIELDSDGDGVVDYSESMALK